MRLDRLAALALLALVACTEDSNIPDVDEDGSAAEVDTRFVEGQILVRFSPDFLPGDAPDLDVNSIATKGTGLATRMMEIGTLDMERLYPDAGKFEKRHREAGLHLWYRITIDKDAYPLEEAARLLESADEIECASPERVVTANALFNDPRFTYQWGLYNDGTLGSFYLEGADINVVPVWKNFSAGSSNVVVAVVDQGVDPKHEDLSGIVLPTGNGGSRCFVDGYDGGDIVPADHGCHVAGIIAAINDNGKGVCGVAGGNDGKGGARIMSCEFLRPGDSSSSIQGNAYNAIVWAADNGAVICQNSWGVAFDTKEDADDYSRLHYGPAIDYFIKNAGIDTEGKQVGPMKGGVVFFSSGNENSSFGCPGMYDGGGKCIAVGATTALNTRATYSNYGDWVDICAPGGDQVESKPPYGMVLSCAEDDGYCYMSGTSMACPYVSGVAALLVSYFGGPGFTNDMLVERLLGGANKNAVSSAYQIGSLLDAYGSFVYGDTTKPDKVSQYSVSAKSNGLVCSARVPSTDGKPVYGLLLLASADKSDLDNVDPRNLPSSVASVSVKCDDASAGEEVRLELADLKFETMYYTAVLAYSYNMVYSDISDIESVATLRNNPPSVMTDYTGDYAIKSHETLTVDYQLYDPDGHVFNYTFTSGSDAVVGSALAEGRYRLVFTGKNAPAGSYNAVFRLRDRYGAEGEYNIGYTVLENHPPQVLKSFDSISMGKIGEEIVFDINDYFYDPDGETLEYYVTTSEKNVAHIFPSGGNLTVTSLGYGLIDVNLTAYDTARKSAALSFQVLVRDGTRPADIYPNPVSDVLHVRPGTDVRISVRIISQTGAVVYEGEEDAAPFAPYDIDVESLPAGVYIVEVKSSDIDMKYTVAKI